MRFKQFQLFTLCLLTCLNLAHANAKQMPIYAAYVSDELKNNCESNHCVLNPLSADQLSLLVQNNELADKLTQALSLSQYEVLIGSALVHYQDNSELVLEITTSWRDIPIDDLNISAYFEEQSQQDEMAQNLIDQWVSHIQNNNILDAEIIYKTLNASNYHTELDLPESIGEFGLRQRALYRDPMQGSIARYVHTDFSDAVVDVSVYPVSPFVHGDMTDEQSILNTELSLEKQELLALVNASEIDNYVISDIQSSSVELTDRVFHGYKLTVALQTEDEPAYSTQYLFKMDDKFIKLTANFPDDLMQALVKQSLANIKVPAESEFMRNMRQG